MIIVEIAGYLGDDPEERFTATGKRVISLRVATRVRHKGTDETVWWRVNIWGDRFDKLLPHLKKGSSVIIIGEMAKPETYTGKDGTTQVSLSLTADIIKFSPFGRNDRDPKQETQRTSAQHGAENTYAAAAAPAQESFASYGSAVEHEPAFAGDDLPF